MAHIVSTDGSIIINAILTKAGRQKLASGVNAFNITKFAVSDDQVDYSITGLEELLQETPQSYPILEPIANGDLMLKTKLYTDYNVNSGARLLAYIEIPNLSQLTTNNLTAISGGRITYAPSTVGTALQTYNFTFNFSGGQPFSAIEYGSSTVVGQSTSAGLEQVSSQNMNMASITINNISSIAFVRKDITAPIYFRMTVTGTRTGATGTYTFKVNPPTSIIPTNTQV